MLKLPKLCSLWTPIIVLLLLNLCFSSRSLICLVIWLSAISGITMNKADKKCCVPNCGKTRLDNVILHIFPNPDAQIERFRSWIYAIGGDILALDNQKIYKYRRVCHTHFESRYHTSSKRLSANAVPTLHLPGFLRRQSLIDITNQDQSVEPAVQVNQPTTSKGSLQLQSPIDITNQDQSVERAAQLNQPTTSKDPSVSIGSNDNPTSMHFSKKAKTSTDKGSKKTKQRSLNATFSSETSTLTRTIKKLQSAKDNYAAKLKKALKLSENPSFKKALQNFTSAAIIFTLMQFREINKPKMGRRYTKKEKTLALAIYKQGPRAYRWLSCIFVLPSPVTLSRMISTAALRPGINQNIFDYLRKRARKMSTTDKLCILMFDEVAITPHFNYNRKRDTIIGFVNNGKKTEKKIADHALVFMIRGVQRNYKLPISYTFCSGSTSKLELVAQIKEMILMLKSVGFTVVATVCDQGATNMSAINYLINETKTKFLRQNVEWRNNTFEVENQDIVPLYDPPHLIKGIRNNLLNKNLLCTIDNVKKTGKWDHILKLYEENPAYRGIRLLPKLTDYHVDPNKIPKMKVKNATQVFSRTVASNMGYLADKGILDSEVKETADIILFFDELFDSVNGSFENSRLRSGKPLLGALTPSSCHSRVWENARPILKSMKFITGQGKCGTVPSISNWIHTIENINVLKKKIFEDYHIKSIWLRHFNQDPLENFFGCIRSHGGRNVNPTCAGFEIAFAALLVNNLSGMHSPGANCEKDTCSTFKSLNKIFFCKKNTYSNVTNEINFAHLNIEHIIVNVDIKNNNPKIKAQLEYVTGFVLKKMKIIYKQCEMCRICFNDEAKSSDYIKRKDYSAAKIYLSYPSETLIDQFSKIQDIVTYIMRRHSNIYNLQNYIKTVLAVHCDYNFIKCDNQKNELINEMQDLSCRFFLNSWCRDVNNLIRGARKDIADNDEVQEMAFKYFLKRRK